MYGTAAKIEPIFPRKQQKSIYIGAVGVSLGYLLSALQLQYWVFLLACLFSFLIFKLRTQWSFYSGKQFAYSKVEDIESETRSTERGSDWEVDNLVREEDIKGWINEVLAQQWMYISQAATETMVSFLDPLFESNRPKYLKFLKVQRLDLGHCPPIIKRVWVQRNDYPTSMSTSAIIEKPQSTVLMVDVQWTIGNAELDIVTAANSDLFGGLVGSVVVRLTDFKFMGTLRVELSGFHEQWPTFTSLLWGFAIKPRFRFETTVVSQYFAAGITPLRDFIKNLLSDSLVRSLVFPKYYEYKLDTPAERENALPEFMCSMCGERTHNDIVNYEETL